MRRIALAVAVVCGVAWSPLAGATAPSVAGQEPVTLGLSVERVSPTTSPTGQPILVHGVGACAGTAEVELSDETGAVLSSAELPGFGAGSGLQRASWAAVVAPAAAGTYWIRLACAGRPSPAIPYEVFSPSPVADGSPLPAEPTAGWPDAGRRETFHGRLGPYLLGPEEPGGPLLASTVVSGPPRPEGDVAITAARFDVVDAAGRSISQADVQLRDLLVVDPATPSPSCPGGTFLLPGEAVLAGGSDRKSYDLPEPYGVVAPADRPWLAGFDLRNRTAEPRTVYLTYDLDIRRDVENVRPVRRYFGSANGCTDYTWAVDGSGVADVQATYVGIQAPGRLVYAIGFQGVGGEGADVRNDRGRLLCRSEPIVAAGGSAGAAPPTTAPPPGSSSVASRASETYSDDPDLLGTTSCDLAEWVRPGERLRFDATHRNDRPRSAVMGIYALFVWEGGGPAGPGGAPPARPPWPAPSPAAPPAAPVPGRPGYAG